MEFPIISLCQHMSQSTTVSGRNLNGVGFLLSSSFSVSYSSSLMYVFSALIQLTKQHNIASNMKNFDKFSTIFTEISKQLSSCMNRSIRDTNLWMYFYAISCAKFQFSCGILKMVGPKMQDFCPRINMLKGNSFKTILRWIMVGQKVPKSYFQSEFSMSKIDLYNMTLAPPPQCRSIEFII